MAIIAAGSKTIIDLSDGKSLSVYLGSNQPKTQINDVNAGTFSPNWTTTAGKLVITPVVYANQTAIALTDTALSITWKRKEGSSTEANLTTGETVTNNVLTVSQNKLSSITSGLLTYIAYVTYTDPDTSIAVNATADISFALVKTGQNAKTAWISGEQVFKYNSAGTVSPTQITLTANLQNVTMGKWQYKNSSGTWTDYPTTSDNASITGTSLVVKPSHGIWVGQSATLRVTTSSSDVGDTTSIYKVSDGATGGAGQNAVIAFLTNENVTFPANSNGYVDTTFASSVVAYSGTTKVAPSVTLPTVAQMGAGFKVESSGLESNEFKIVFSARGIDVNKDSGTIPIKVTSPVSATLNLTWSKAKAGTDAEDGVVFTIYSPYGTVFNNGKVEGRSAASLTLNTQFYKGATDFSSDAYFLWQRYESGAWTTFKEEAEGASGGKTCTVKPDDVQATCAFRCRARLDASSDVYYYDTITIIDKTDNYQADIDSTAGDVFKNTIGETCLICRLWQAGAEVDPLKCTTFSVTAPSSPTGGTYYYKITKSPTVSHNTAVMRYSTPVGDWVDVTGNTEYGHTKTYKWYRRDKDGNPLDSGAVFATGKVIFVNSDDVDGKTVFVCEVE